MIQLLKTVLVVVVVVVGPLKSCLTMGITRVCVCVFVSICFVLFFFRALASLKHIIGEATPIHRG